MTKLRQPLTYHRALTRAADILGWDRLAAICGVGERTVRNWSDPDTEAEIGLVGAERIDKACMDAGYEAPFFRTYSLRIELATNAATTQDFVRIAGAAAKESGEAVKAMLDAAESSDPRTRRQAIKEAEEAVTVLTNGISMLQAGGAI